MGMAILHILSKAEFNVHNFLRLIEDMCVSKGDAKNSGVHVEMHFYAMSILKVR